MNGDALPGASCINALNQCRVIASRFFEDLFEVVWATNCLRTFLESKSAKSSTVSWRTRSRALAISVESPVAQAHHDDSEKALHIK
eukprot:6476754-Amphidinium_carterae.1